MIDIKKARSAYDENGLYDMDKAGVFCDYAPSYVITNEDLRHAMVSLQPKDKDVLTVAGSGDQPLFFDLNSAKSVDTFDISYCAKVMMDLKTSAIPVLNKEEYHKFIKDIGTTYFLPDLPVYKNLKNLQPESDKFIRDMKGCRIFREVPASGYFNLPLEFEYKKLQQSVNKSYNFIWTDLKDLHRHLNKSYDIIYLSNIIQYNCDEVTVAKVVENLRPFMKSKSILLLHVSAYFTFDELSVFKKIAKSISAWADVRYIHDSVQDLLLIKKR